MRLPLIASLAALSAASCSKLVDVDLQVVEPCGQEDKALNGVTSFRMLSSGADATDGDNVVAFKTGEPSGMSVGLSATGLVVTVEGYAEDITVAADPTAPTVAPRSVGRTMPLLITETSPPLRGTILVGGVDTFGSPRDVDGNCSTMGGNGTAVGGRHAHTVTYVPGANKVLIFGGAVWADPDGDGVVEESFLRSAEVFDPLTGTFSKLPDPANPRAYHTATALGDGTGRVIIWGGLSTLNGATAALRNAEIVDINNAASPYTTVLTASSRAHHTATLLADIGLLVVVGGCTGSAADGCSTTSAAGDTTGIVPSIELMSLSDLTSTKSAQGTLALPRAMHQAVGFASGNAGVIAIVGGLNAGGPLRGIEVLQVDNGDIVNINSTADALPRPLVRHQATLFNAERIEFAVTGGQDQAPGGALSTAAPGTNEVLSCSLADNQVSCLQLPALQTARHGHAAVRLRDGTLLVMGGVTPPGAASAEGLRAIRGSNPPEFGWEATSPAGPLAVPRDRAAFTLLGGEDAGSGFVNQVFYSGGHSTTAPFLTSNLTDIYFGK